MTPEERATRRARVLEKVRRAGPWPLSMLAAAGEALRRPPWSKWPWRWLCAALGHGDHLNCPPGSWGIPWSCRRCGWNADHLRPNYDR